jgi:hypothetical protein
MRKDSSPGDCSLWTEGERGGEEEGGGEEL